MKFILPYPRTLNSMYDNVPGKGRIKTGQYTAWKKEAGWELAIQLMQVPHKERELKGKYEIILRPKRPDNRIRDIDNLPKCVLDLLKAHHVIEADHLTEDMNIRWRYDGPPGIAVKLKPFDKSNEAFDDWW